MQRAVQGIFADSRFLLTGASGFLGRPTLAGLCQRLPQSARIVSLARSSEYGPDDPRIDRVVCDLSRQAHALEGAAREALLAADYIIWMASSRDHAAPLAALWRVNVAPLLRALAVLQHSTRLKRIIYVSSVSAVDQEGRPSRPIGDDAVPAPATRYGVSKLLAETAVRSAGLPHAVLRLPFLYGPGFSPGSFMAWYARVANLWAVRACHLPGRLSLLYTADFAALCLAVCAGHGLPPGNAPYAVSDGKIYPVDQLIQAVAAALGSERDYPYLPRVIPRSLHRLLARSRLDYWRHAAFDPNYFTLDSSRFRADFPGVAFTPLADALPQCFARSGGSPA